MKRITIGIAFMYVFLACAPLCAAEEAVDILWDKFDMMVKKLEEKGIFTHSEAKGFLEETKREIKAEISESGPKEPPAWYDRVKIGGDVRFRQQVDWRDDQHTNYRQRVRGRLKVTSKVNEEFDAGLRVVSGNDAPTSTNQTLANFFDSKTFMLDWAYIGYTPAFLAGQTKVLMGLFKKPFYATNLLWDGDVSFGGVAVKASKSSKEIGCLKKMPPTDFFVNAGAFPLDNVADDWDDPWLNAVQGGFSSEIMDGVTVKTALTYYDYINVKNYNINRSQGGNTRSFAGGNILAKDFNLINVPSEIWVKDPLPFLNADRKERSLIPYAGAHGDFVANVSTGEGGVGYLVGGKVGNKKLAKKGDWQFGYNYRNMGANAQVDTFPDGDFYGTGTGAYGHNVSLAYNLYKNTYIKSAWWLTYRNRKVFDDTDKMRSLFQVDAGVKF